MDDVIIVGAGIGGLTLGLALQLCGIPCRILESAAGIRPIGVHRHLEARALGRRSPLRLETAQATGRGWGSANASV
jgi:5-methylphenazine-1-carboxylate 1-monooxygenase